MKKIIISVTILFFLFIGAVLGLNYFFKNQIVYFLENALADNISLTYDNVSVDSWGGTVTLNNGKLSIRKRGDTLINTKISSSQIRFSQLSYWDYFVNNTVHIEEITVDENTIWFLNDRGVKKKKNTGPIRLGKAIRVDHLKIGETSLEVLKPGPDSLSMKINRASFSLKDILIDREIVTRKIPLNYGAMHMEADTTFLKISPYENLTIDLVRFEEKNLNVINGRIRTKYSKKKLSSQINIERDHVDLHIPELSLNGVNWGFDQGELYTLAQVMKIKQPSLEIYRDKLVADDPTAKPLYSAMLRSIPFDLMLDSLVINDAHIIYNEKVKEEQPAGKIDFSKLNVKASKLGNTYARGEDTTHLAIKGIFMESAPININWSFDVQNPQDHFNLKGFMSELPAERINRFTEPNLRAQMEGEVERVYFNINGDNIESQIDMRMIYDDFKVVFLNKKSEKKKFLSAIANLFVSDDSKDPDENGYREGRGSAERDKTKSFFNYLWLNLKDGLVEVLLGDGRR